MDIKRDRMVYLGYGKYWRSDAIVGLMPIEADRGPGRRTEVYTSSLPAPIVASRTEQAILADMGLSADDDAMRLHEAHEILGDVADAFSGLSDVLRRMLANEAKMDVDLWLRRIRRILRDERPAEPDENQNELFS
jgi:hypothetical protein